MKTIFLSSHHSHSVKQLSGAHSIANNDDDPAGGATPVALPVPATDEQIMATAEQPLQHWLFTGMRNAL